MSFEKFAGGRDCGKEGLERGGDRGLTAGEADRPGSVGLLNLERIRESELCRMGREEGDGERVGGLEERGGGGFKREEGEFRWLSNDGGGGGGGNAEEEENVQ